MSNGTTEYRGIDYGMGRTTNIDTSNGIRYGVISLGALHEFAAEAFEPEYGDPACPECGGPVIAAEDGYSCDSCERLINSQDAYGEEPHLHNLNDGEYTGFLDSYNDVMLVKSPYYTHAQFCSPCAPGAGHLEHPCENGPKTYCFGPDWFDNDSAPYPIYRVTDDMPI